MTISFIFVVTEIIQGSLNETLKSLTTMTTMTRNYELMIQCFIASNLPQPSSSASERDYHQQIWNDEMKTRYHCGDPSNPDVTKCMLLNIFLPTSEMTTTHIISIKNRGVLPMLGMNSEDIWSPQNGLLLHTPIKNRFAKLEVVSIIITTL